LTLALDDSSSDFETNFAKGGMSPGTRSVSFQPPARVLVARDLGLAQVPTFRYKSERTTIEESKTTTVRTYKRPSSRASTVPSDEGIPLSPPPHVFEAQPVRLSSAQSAHVERDRDAGDVIYSSRVSEREETRATETYPMSEERDHERESLVYRYLPLRAGLDEQDRSIYETSVVQN